MLLFDRPNLFDLVWRLANKLVDAFWLLQLGSVCFGDSRPQLDRVLAFNVFFTLMSLLLLLIIIGDPCNFFMNLSTVDHQYLFISKSYIFYCTFSFALAPWSPVPVACSRFLVSIWPLPVLFANRHCSSFHFCKKTYDSGFERQTVVCSDPDQSCSKIRKGENSEKMKSTLLLKYLTYLN